MTENSTLICSLIIFLMCILLTAFGSSPGPVTTTRMVPVYTIAGGAS